MISFNRRKSREKKKRTKKVIGCLQRPRIVISKSNRYLTVQAIDDINQRTLAYLSTCKLVIDKKNKEINKVINHKSKESAAKLGLEFAKKLSKENIVNVIFDRNGYVYHGKIKTFCETMRKLGINF